MMIIRVTSHYYSFQRESKHCQDSISNSQCETDHHDCVSLLLCNKKQMLNEFGFLLHSVAINFYYDLIVVMCNSYM